MQYTQIEKPSLAEAAANALRALITDGKLPDGQRINEVHLSAQLGISRTPLREALSLLVAEGSVENRPRIGFFVKPLSIEEFTQIYDLRPILDPAALKMAGLPTPSQLSKLETLNSKFGKTKNAEEAILIDDQFHLELLAHCPNRVIIELIEGFMRRTRRYELALMRETKRINFAQVLHDDIIVALKSRQLKTACLALEENMRHGRDPIIAWLEERNHKTKVSKK